MIGIKRLARPGDLVKGVAELFARHGSVATLEVFEDVCFSADTWVSLGAIRLQPEENFEQAVSLGFYVWEEPDQPTAEAEWNKAFAKQPSSLGRVLDAVESTKHRLGLLSPLWDAQRFSEFPFSRPVTIVSDTTGVQQGALDFVARFLTPAARLKIPAIVQMEILNRADNYFKARRRPGQRSAATALDHILSQGGQRTLLRLEHDRNVEVERGHLVDPLRGIVAPSSDPEDKNLGLQDIQRSFADRLIFETARQHRFDANHGHPTYLLTSDQGLARMSMAEGLPALFFQSPKAGFARTLSGVRARPFDRGLFSIPLLSVLWEFAVCFGMARLRFSESECVTVCALGGETSWQPFHCQDDLLWVSIQTDSTGNSVVAPLPLDPEPAGLSENRASTPISDPRGPATKNTQGSYAIDPIKFVKILEYFRSNEHLHEEALGTSLGLQSRGGIDEVKRFLKSGGFLADGLKLSRSQLLVDLIEAADRLNLELAATHLRKCPSFNDFVGDLERRRVLRPEDVTLRAYRCYGGLAELFGLGLRIQESGLIWAGRNPLPSDFAKAALRVYRVLSGTGKTLF